MGEVTHADGPVHLDFDADGPVVRSGSETYLVKPFQFWEINSVDSTTEETFQEAMSRTSAAMAAGIYIVTWTFEMRVVASGSLDSQGIARFAIDGNVKNNTAITIEEWVVFSGWDRYSATLDDTPDFDIEYRRDPGLGGNDTIEIRRMRIGAEFKG